MKRRGHWLLSLCAIAALAFAGFSSYKQQGTQYRVTIAGAHGDTIYFPNPDSCSLNWLPKTGGSGVADSSIAVPFIRWDHFIGTARCTLFVFSAAVPAGIDTIPIPPYTTFGSHMGSWGGVNRLITKVAVAVHAGGAADTILVTATD